MLFTGPSVSKRLRGPPTSLWPSSDTPSKFSDPFIEIYLYLFYLRGESKINSRVGTTFVFNFIPDPPNICGMEGPFSFTVDFFKHLFSIPNVFHEQCKKKNRLCSGTSNPRSHCRKYNNASICSVPADSCLLLCAVRRMVLPRSDSMVGCRHCVSIFDYSCKSARARAACLWKLSKKQSCPPR